MQLAGAAFVRQRAHIIVGLEHDDMVCGTIGRPCSKLLRVGHEDRLTEVKPYNLPPPCIYMFPGTIPSVRNNPTPIPQQLYQV